MYYSKNNLYTTLRGLPDAAAVVRGSGDASRINGTVKFYQRENGALVAADIFGLPVSAEKCKNNIFAFHIHSGGECTGNGEDPFANAGTHYDPDNCPHPYHAGDMPPLFGSAGGRAFLAFFTDRFTVDEVVGKTAVIHDSPDDFTTQPSGNAGRKIACGVITKVRR